MDISAVYVVALHVVRHIFDNSGKALAIIIAVCIVLFYVVFVLVASRRLLRRVFGPPRPPWEFDLDEIPSWLLLEKHRGYRIVIPLQKDDILLDWLVKHHWEKLQAGKYWPNSFLAYGETQNEKIRHPADELPIWFDGNNVVVALLWQDLFRYDFCVTLSSRSSKALHTCMEHLQFGHSARDTQQMIYTHMPRAGRCVFSMRYLTPAKVRLY